MANTEGSRSPLSHIGGDGPPTIEGQDVHLSEQSNIGKVNLRGDPADLEFLAAVRGALEIDLPLAPNTSSETPPVSALWLGPDEWMLVCAPGSEGAVADSLVAALLDQHAAVVDVSDARTVLRLSGSSARTVLAKGCALDLHPRAFAFGDVAQTTLAKATIILHQTADETDEDGPVFDIYVARSFTDYLWWWFTDTIR
jgi:sarcosine oxidase subunit gamma